MNSTAVIQEQGSELQWDIFLIFFFSFFDLQLSNFGVLYILTVCFVLILHDCVHSPVLSLTTKKKQTTKKTFSFHIYTQVTVYGGMTIKLEMLYKKNVWFTLYIL